VSVHRIERPDGSIAWRVRWRDGGRGTSSRARTFHRKREAVMFEDELRRRRRLGDLGIVIGSQETLDEYVAQTWARTHAPTLAPSTAKVYASLYDFHISPSLGALKLAELTPEVIARWQAERLAAGAGKASLRKAMTLLGSILQLALESERIGRNPVRLVRKARQPAKSEVRPLAPATVEAMRAASDHRDATLMSVLAYAGLRPQEALLLRWRDVGARTLIINAPKTGQRRSVKLLKPLIEDLAAWRGAQRSPGRDALLFPAHDGAPWRLDAYKGWARKAARGRRKKDSNARAGSPGP